MVGLDVGGLVPGGEWARAAAILALGRELGGRGGILN